MSAPAITLAALRKLSPCEGRLEFAEANLPKRGKITAQMAVDAGCTFNDLVWIASAISRTDKSMERRVRHWLADCATRVLPVYERDYPADMRVRNAIIAAHAFADGEIDDAAGAAARAAAWDAARDAAGAARDAAWAARDAAWAAWAATWDAAGDAARAAAWDAAWAARDAARAAEERWQFDRLLMWLSDNEPGPLAMPAVLEVAA